MAADSSNRQVGVGLIAAGHFVHDVFTGYLAPLLPLLIDKLGLSLAQAGSLQVFQQLPSLANPLLGAWLERAPLRWGLALAPLGTALGMSLLGVAPSYAALALLLLFVGVNNSLWHVPAPVVIARVAGARVGRGMSLFMFGGELARSVGPLVAIGAVSLWGLEGIWRTLPLAMVASALLAWRLRHLPPVPARGGAGVRAAWGEVRGVMLPIAGIIAARSAMIAAMTTFLPTLLTQEGGGLWLASGALSAVELAGALGVATSGTLSDHLGRRTVLMGVMVLSPLLLLLFLAASGWFLFPAVLLFGFVGLSTNPVLLALVQEHAPGSPAAANGIFMLVSFLLRALVVLLVGAVADRVGLRQTFLVSALVGFAGLPFAAALPRRAGV
ncbi:MAG: MFS transporter [Deltaproteobacteria bacterium]|nr:MFS transporter [Deltaproteobacteria bacterium]